MVLRILLCAAVLPAVCYGLEDQNVLDSTTVACAARHRHSSGFYDPTAQCNNVQVPNQPDGSETRRFGVYVPDNYDPTTPYPVIFDFHGALNTPASQYRNSRYDQNDEGKKYLVIYPEGLNKSWQGAPNHSSNDTAFIEALLPYVKQRYCVDNDRIFASGKSQGGGFVDQLACNPALGDQFAAFAMASPALYKHTEQSMCQYRPRKILESHGDEDGTIPYEGGTHRGVQLPSIEDWTWWWANATGYQTRKYVNTSQPYYDVVTYIGSSDGSVVQHYYIRDLGHCWPQTTGYGMHNGCGHPEVLNTDYKKYCASDTLRHCVNARVDFTSEAIQFFEAAVSVEASNSSPADEL